jgi:hypothetical protein
MCVCFWFNWGLVAQQHSQGAAPVLQERVFASLLLLISVHECHLVYAFWQAAAYRGKTLRVPAGTRKSAAGAAELVFFLLKLAHTLVCCLEPLQWFQKLLLMVLRSNCLTLRTGGLLEHGSGNSNCATR